MILQGGGRVEEPPPGHLTAKGWSCGPDHSFLILLASRRSVTTSQFSHRKGIGFQVGLAES